MERDERAMNKADEIYEDRGKKYGDASLNYRNFTKVIQAMVEQTIQRKLPVDLPDDFGALVMVQCKILRECKQFDADNYVDAENYLRIAQETLKPDIAAVIQKAAKNLSIRV